MKKKGRYFLLILPIVTLKNRTNIQRQGYELDNQTHEDGDMMNANEKIERTHAQKNYSETLEQLKDMENEESSRQRQDLS